jgi:hypothetical protein
MRSNEMTEEQHTRALLRYEHAEEILADYEAQHRFTLPKPWRDLVPRLLLQGLGDPELHAIFDAAAQVEFESGRLAEQPADDLGFKD